MADHLDSPGLMSPATDARVDITDHYAFQKPGDSTKTILILDVNPVAPTHADEFRHNALYETLVDNNGDARPDISFRYRFTRKDGGRQFARVTRAFVGETNLEEGHVHEELEKEVLVEHAPVSFGTEAHITRGEAGIRFFAGFRSDPFFFVLTFDRSSPAQYLNGRRLQDDVIDVSLNLVTNGRVTGDGVGPHHDYLSEFPYLGSPHV